jgi:hypothetical protein
LFSLTPKITALAMAALSPPGRDHLPGAAISNDPAEGRFICARRPLRKKKQKKLKKTKNK